MLMRSIGVLFSLSFRYYCKNDDLIMRVFTVYRILLLQKGITLHVHTTYLVQM